MSNKVISVSFTMFHSFLHSLFSLTKKNKANEKEVCGHEPFTRYTIRYSIKFLTITTRNAMIFFLQMFTLKVSIEIGGDTHTHT